MKKIFPVLAGLCVSFNILFGQGIINGDFELGKLSGWTSYSKGNYTLIGPASYFSSTEITPPVSARSGQYVARLGGFGYEVNSISQTVTLPNTKPLYLRLYVQDRNSTTSECAGLWVGSQIRVYVAGQKIYDVYLCRYSQSESWIAGYFDLTAVAGQTVVIGVQADAPNSVWSFLYIDDVSFTNQITDVDGKAPLLPVAMELTQNFPNPFNPSTSIQISLTRSTHVSLKIFNVLGEEMDTIVDEVMTPGTYTKSWNGSHVPSGVYFVRLDAGGSLQTRKIVLTK
ncbi:MAG: T9SS type A sorting domain-containing protein [Ignavibacteriales bacterium]|nr:T9SS type A sorting domain-containing protein [Ignavibacteriales bacterium]